MLLTIAGSSCSGKTTAARACARLPGLVVHDFDEIGVPSGADVRWRQRSLERWLRRVLRHQRAGRDVLLLGQSPLGEILAAPSATELDGIAAALLDVADGERLRRLADRDPGRWSAERLRAFVGWADWHRAHAADPRHRPEAITTASWPAMAWARWSGWAAGDPRWRVAVLDTTGRTVAQSATDVHGWVSAARADHRWRVPTNWAAI